MAEAVVVGAGVVGASTAFHLAERGVDTLVLDPNGPAAASTPRSGALVRAHYPTALEADLAWESLTGYFEPWGVRVGGGCGFTRTGFARLAGEDDIDALKSNVAMLRDEVGVETELVSPEEVADLDPAIETGDVALAAYEPRGGYADPSATAVGFLRAAEALGARFEARRVTGLLAPGDEIRGVETDAGAYEAPVVVLAAGAWSVPLAAGVGLELPITPARAQVALFERPYSMATHLTVIDPVLGIYARPTADHCTLVGHRTEELEELDDPDRFAPEPDRSFVEKVGDRLGRRIPALAGVPYRLGRAGVLDMTPDGRPILGPEGPDGLYLAAGWSGTGFKKAPAVGAELARWATDGRPRRPRLSGYTLRRFEMGNLISGEHEYGVRSPH
jgi:sarcosine oxidase, subunit beta